MREIFADTCNLSAGLFSISFIHMISNGPFFSVRVNIRFMVRVSDTACRKMDSLALCLSNGPKKAKNK